MKCSEKNANIFFPAHSGSFPRHYLDKSPPCVVNYLTSPTTCDHPSIELDVMILPVMKIGLDSLISYESVSTKDISPAKPAIDNPVRFKDLTKEAENK